MEGRWDEEKEQGQPASFSSPRQEAACWIIEETGQPQILH